MPRTTDEFLPTDFSPFMGEDDDEHEDDGPQHSGYSPPEDFVIRPYGVEIEAAWARDSARPFEPARWHSGDGQCRPPYNRQWRAESDSSIRPSGIEFISPPLESKIDGIRQTIAMYAQIQRDGGYINPSCGGHIHIGWDRTQEDRHSCEAADSDPHFWRYQHKERFSTAMPSSVSKLEEGMFLLTGSLWRYRVTRHAEPYKKQGGRASGVTRQGESSSGARYRCIIRTPHNTFEHRYPSGTLDATQFVINLMLAQTTTDLFVRGAYIPSTPKGVSPIDDAVRQCDWLCNTLGWVEGGKWYGLPYAFEGCPELPSEAALLALIARKRGAWNTAVRRFYFEIDQMVNDGIRDAEEEVTQQTPFID